MSIAEQTKAVFIEQTMNAVRQAEKFLRRDFHEIESLKTEGNKLELFSRRARDRSGQLMYNFLSKYYNNLFLLDDVDFNMPCPFDEASVFEPLTDLDNFSRNLPFFASVAGVVKKNASGNMQPAAIAINFPILGIIAHTTSGQTSKIENISGSIPGIRNARVANTYKTKNAIAIINTATIEDLKLLQNHNITSDRTLCFNSAYYALLVLIGGKADILKADFGTPHAASLAAMLVDNAGGYSKVVGSRLEAACSEELMLPW